MEHATSRTPRAAKEEPILSNVVKHWGTSRVVDTLKATTICFVSHSQLHIRFQTTHRYTLFLWLLHVCACEKKTTATCHVRYARCLVHLAPVRPQRTAKCAIPTRMTIISYNLKDLKPYLFQTINRKLITESWINSACFISWQVGLYNCRLGPYDASVSCLFARCRALICFQHTYPDSGLRCAFCKNKILKSHARLKK